jgi:hypothetical protein
MGTCGVFKNTCKKREREKCKVLYISTNDEKELTLLLSLSLFSSLPPSSSSPLLPMITHYTITI